MAPSTKRELTEVIVCNQGVLVSGLLSANPHSCKGQHDQSIVRNVMNIFLFAVNANG